MTRAAKLLLVPLLALQVAFFTFVALHRFVDGDEGFYLLGSRLVLMHKKPYLDFSYTQVPLLLHVYALRMMCTAVSWVSAKLFSALLTAFSVLCNMSMFAARRETGSLAFRRWFCLRRAH